MTKKPKIQRKPRKPRTEPYTKINSYTLSPAIQQIITVIIFLIQLVLHEIFVTVQVVNVNKPILWVMAAFRYVILILLVHDYIWLTIHDPVDRLILDEKRRYKYKDYQVRHCQLCNSNVLKSSHHCMTCNRCTEDFDHHCKYLNNCIGVRNYEYFMRLLTFYVIFSFLGIGIAIWVLIENGDSIQLQEYQKWMIVVYFVIAGLLTVAAAILAGFHFWISCCVNLTTLQFIYQSPDQKKDKKKKQSIVIQPQPYPEPLSAERFHKSIQNRAGVINSQGERQAIQMMTLNNSSLKKSEYM